MHRRTFLAGIGAIGAANAVTKMLGCASPSEPTSASSAETQGGAATRRLSADVAIPPNILVFITDQMRFPVASAPLYWSAMPNVSAFMDGAVNFAEHYTAAVACTTARACLVTGLYSYQHYCMRVIGSPYDPPLNPAFPTYGSILGQLGYQTPWFGKWHLSTSTSAFCQPADCQANWKSLLDPYGFQWFGPCPSDDGGVGEGCNKDPLTVEAFESWVSNPTGGGSGPWCATVSIVNPHDIAQYPKNVGGGNTCVGELSPGEQFAMAAGNNLLNVVPNYETQTALQANKPRLQSWYQTLCDAGDEAGGGATIPHGPSTDPAVISWYTTLLDSYLQLHGAPYMDAQFGAVMNALKVNNQLDNTIVIFTADHGEYGGAHGLRDKGGGAYEETLRVPLLVRDFRPGATMVSGTRNVLTSSVDVVPLILTLATGSSQWRSNAQYSYLAKRWGLASLLANASGAGRPFVLHTTDEWNYGSPPAPPSIPNPHLTPTSVADYHVVAIRTPTAKLVTYNQWATSAPGNVTLQPGEFELYNYTLDTSLSETDNLGKPVSQASTLQTALYTLLQSAFTEELQAPLVSYEQAQSDALTAYLAYPAVNQCP